MLRDDHRHDPTLALGHEATVSVRLVRTPRLRLEQAESLLDQRSPIESLELVDSCVDHHGVKGWAWRNGRLVGEKYNGKGYRQKVIWDPFGDLQHGEVIGIKVCLVDGNNDPSAWPCSIEGDRKVVNE